MSFLPFFSIVQLNFSALLVLIINIFEDPKSNIGIYCAFLIGFLSDIFLLIFWFNYFAFGFSFHFDKILFIKVC